MKALVEELMKEHSEILAILNEVKRLGILSKEGQVKLMSAKKTFAYTSQKGGQATLSVSHKRS